MSKYQKVEKRSWSQLSQSGKKQVSCGVVGDSPMVNPRTQRSLGHQALNVTNFAFTRKATMRSWILHLITLTSTLPMVLTGETSDAGGSNHSNHPSFTFTFTFTKEFKSFFLDALASLRPIMKSD